MRRTGQETDTWERSEIRSAPEQRLTLDRILAEEDAVTRHMIYCRFVDGMRVEEVAEVTGFCAKTVTKRLT